MLRALLGLCVRRHVLVAMLSLVALVAGGQAALNAPLDVFPDFVPSQVDVQTEAPGFAPPQVEQLVTRPLESALNGAAGLATLRSESTPGLSAITITFAAGIDPHVARQGIAERLAEVAGSLPTGVATPKLSPLVSSTMDLLKVGLVSDKVDAYTLRDAADWQVVPRLLAVPGVAHVLVFGGAVRQIQVQPDVRKLAAYGFTLNDVVDAARAAVPLRGAGFIDLPAQRVLLESPTPRPDIAALGQAVVAMRNGVAVRLGDLADIREAPALKSGDALVMGRPGVMLSLASQYGANTLEATHAVEAALDELKPALAAQGITLVPALHRPANFIERALGNLERSLAIATLLILAVLYLFLRDWRAALIAFTAIPLSLLAAVAVLERAGMTLNTMTLGGFAVALGVLVDDAIIGIENILRRLRANATAGVPQPRLTVILESSLEVRGPVIYATAVVIAAFLPALLTSSVQGSFVRPLALAFIAAVVASLLVALTTTPALCALLLHDEARHADSSWMARVKGWQRAAIDRALRHLRVVLIALGAAAVAAIATVPFLGGSFMPDFREGHFVVQLTGSLPGISLQSMLDAGGRISREILALPYVQTVEQQVGRAELGEDTWGPHQSELHVELKPDAQVDQAEAQEALRGIVEHYPGLQGEVVTFLGDRISESLNGETAQVAIKVYGPDLDALDRAGADITRVLTGLDGIADLQFRRQDGTPTLSIEPEPARLAAFGLRASDVLDSVQAAYAGADAGQTFDGIRAVDTTVLLPDAVRNRPESLGQLMIQGPLGPVPLARIAGIHLRADRYSIEHDGGQRRISVTFNAEHGSVAALVTQVRRVIAQTVQLPPGVYLEYTGAAAAQEQTQRELLLYSGMALVLVLTLLLAAFRWRANGWMVLANLPFSLIGSVLVIAASGIGLSLGAAVGLVTVFGISARNGILQLAHYEHLLLQERVPWNRDTALRGANERLIPILMTATVTALGLLPLAIGSGTPGQEIEGPMAITVLGGLLSSTVLNLCVLPAMAQRFLRPTSP